MLLLLLSRFSHVRLLATSWTAAHQAPLSMRFSRQEYCSGLSFPSPGDLPNSGIPSCVSCLAGRFFTTEPPGKLPVPYLIPLITILRHMFPFGFLPFFKCYFFSLKEAQIHLYFHRCSSTDEICSSTGEISQGPDEVFPPHFPNKLPTSAGS